MKRRFAIVLILTALSAAAQNTVTNEFFEFSSGFWINLHHFLYLQAVLATPDARKDGATAVQRTIAAHRMTPEQRTAWDSALAYYRQFGNSDPLRDRTLIGANYELSDAGNDSSLAKRRLAPEMRTALEAAAPVYRALWWDAENRVNRHWIDVALPLVNKYGRDLSTKLASTYRTKWPKEKIQVEVVSYANWAGAYTTLNSTLITVSSVDPANQGNAALEILFHEASHALVGGLQEALSKQSQTQGVTLDPPTLWHAILFYTTGALIKNVIPDYTPLADSIGLWVRAWPMYIGPLKQDWQPYLDGKTSFESAVAAIVKDAAHPKPAPQK